MSQIPPDTTREKLVLEVVMRTRSGQSVDTIRADLLQRGIDEDTISAVLFEAMTKGDRLSENLLEHIAQEIPGVSPALLRNAHTFFHRGMGLMWIFFGLIFLLMGLFFAVGLQEAGVQAGDSPPDVSLYAFGGLFALMGLFQIGRGALRLIRGR